MSAVAKLAALPRNTRRGIALGMLVLLMLLAWFLVVMPIRLVASSQDDWRTEISRQISRDRGMVKSATRIREASVTVRNAPIRSRLYAAGAVSIDDQLQNDLRAALMQSGVEPTTFKILPGSTAKGLREHRVEFASIMSVDQLRSLYTALEQQAHYVRVERLRIESPASQATNENPRLTLLMEVRGYSLEAQPEPAATRVARAN